MYIITTKYCTKLITDSPQGHASQGKCIHYKNKMLHKTHHRQPLMIKSTPHKACVHNNNKILHKTHHKQTLKGKPHEAFMYIINIKTHHRQPVKGTLHKANVYIITTKYCTKLITDSPQGHASQGKCIHYKNKMLHKTHHRQPLMIKSTPHKAYVHNNNKILHKTHHKQTLKGKPHEAFMYIINKNSSQTARQGYTSQGKCVHNNNKILHKTHHRQPLKGKPHKAFVYIITTKYCTKTHHKEPVKGTPHKANVCT